jgi:predicted ATPase
MAYIRSLKTSRFLVKFERGEHNGNRIHVITGPNGSGKTQVLTALALEYRYGSQAPSLVRAAEPPQRAIAQTFSPFSRFPSPYRGKHTLSDIYRDEVERADIYRPVGFHKSLRHTGGAFSRHVLEQAIFRLSEHLDRALMLGRILQYLGFKQEIHLAYRPKPAMRSIVEAQMNGSLSELLEQGPVHGIDLRRVAKEILADDRDSVLDLLRTAIEVIRPSVLRQPRIRHEMVFFGSPSSSYAELQALSVLRRFNLLSLEECTLYRPDGEEIELSQASSGQQQLLCSLFGIASEATDNSLILIDEPELSLHPRWQISFLDQLVKLLSAVQGCHVLVATHSPLIVQKAQELGLGIVSLAHDEPEAMDSQLSAGSGTSSVEETLNEVF